MRSLRRFTRACAETIVVENGPDDPSAEYLRQLRWIRYFENPHPRPDHRNGLDLGVRESSGEWVLVLHTDSFVRREGWLEFLLGQIEDDTVLLGSQDRVIQPIPWYLALDDRRRRRKLERRWEARGQTPKILSHCALYHRSLFTEHGQRFDHPETIDGVYNDCGEILQRYCEASGLGIRFLRRSELAPWMWHVEAATLNLVTGRKVPFKRRWRAKRFYARPEIQALLRDASLDA
jgi:hypothetical protein